MDWVKLLDDNQIEWVSRGPNTKRGEVSIKCPWCGGDDPSQHLGINLTTENWGCHRNGQHRGKNPNRLIAAMLGVSHGQARLIFDQYSKPDPSTLGEALTALQATSDQPRAIEAIAPKLALPLEFQPIKSQGSTRRFWQYLESRGFIEITDLQGYYNLTCCTTGRYKDRIIIPFYQEGQLIGWTGRAIQKTVTAPRYLSSGGAVKTTIFNEGRLQEGGKLLFITEGPFDALKIDYYGGIARATCIFGTTMTMDQISIINSLIKKFDKVILLFDREAVEQTFNASDWLTSRDIIIGNTPDWAKDPGELNYWDVVKLVKEYDSM